ncbi:heparinase II/III family protein [Halomonas sp. BL6]|uniref:heparinase II/III domain-containing protein n=1 Tax=Halomonas sp. BL6 TaxID=2585770 RepID=UPI0011182C08|nr:heparinase II/III family protein [Halomonas sp. BL6]TNH16621.1 hypothetical protein FHJ80_10035 [Halomonas sp. BL6]
MSYINKYDAFRIGKQGSVFDECFKFKARADCQELIINKDYRCDDIGDQNQLAQILMFRFLDSYLRNFKYEKNVSATSCLEIMLSIDHAHENHKISWDPMVSGTRLLKYLYFKYVVSDFVGEDLLEKLNARINYTIDRLVKIKYHNSNHYLQGLHALVAASVLEGRSDLEYFRDLAVSMFCDLFNEEGFYKENSAEYHFYAISMIKDFDSCGWYASDQLSDLLVKAERFNHILFARVGEVFAFGDTDRDLVKRQVSKGVIKIGDYDSGKLNVKPITGIVRSRTADDRYSSELMLVNFYHGQSHNHHDYCAFEWFVNDGWVLLDPGKFSYSKSEKSEYFYKDKSHNTVNFSSFGHDYKNSLKYVGGEDNVAFNKVIGGIADEKFVFRRELKHGPNYIDLKDTLIFQKASRKSKIISSFNVSPHYSEVERVSNNELLFSSEKTKFRISSNKRLSVLFGNENPCFGWVSEKYNTSVPCWYVYVDIAEEFNMIDLKIKFEILNF